MPLVADNITPLPVDTDSLEEWVDECVRIFKERHEQNPYDAFMTRTMPPESIEVGKRIKELFPDVSWIASLADPIAKSPYDLKAWVIDPEDVNEAETAGIMYALRYGADAYRDHPRDEFRKLCERKDIEDFAIQNADALIFPHEALCAYVLGSRRRQNAYVVHHSYDKSLYPAATFGADEGKVKIAFTGHTDSVRSLEPVVRALHHLKSIDAKALAKLDISFVGHVEESVRALIFNYDLYNSVRIVPNMGYVDTLGVMQDADWLIHVDAQFDFLSEEGGSVFFAGKIADYMGTDAPILGITGKHSPAYEIITRAGGVCLEGHDVAGIAEVLSKIADGVLECPVDRSYRNLYDAKAVAVDYDAWVEQLASSSEFAFDRVDWPVIENMGSCKQKFLSICVPAYNVESYLDRCLFSLVSCPVADQLEIIVVDDGSPDHSAAIALAYERRYPSVVRVIRKENGGHGSTINAALEQATGIYFRVVDGDDWLDGANLATLVNNIREQDKWADLVSTNYHQVFMESGDMVPWEKCSGDLEDYKIYDFATTDMTQEYFTMASMMAKTELLRSVGFEIQEHTYYVDVEYLLFAIPFIETVMFTPEYVYRYAVGNAEQSINPNVFTSRYDHHDRVIRRMLAYYAQYADMMEEGQRNYMKSLFVRHLVNSHYMLSLMWDPDKERGYARAKDFDAYLQETAPEIYSEYGKTHPVVMALRATGFNPAVGTRPGNLEPPNPRDKIYGAAQFLSRYPLGYKIVHNETLRGVARKLVR